MRTSLGGLTSVATILLSLASAHPADNTDTTESITTRKIALSRRESGGLRARDGGAVDWNRTNAHISAARSKYSHTGGAHKRNSMPFVAPPPVSDPFPIPNHISDATTIDIDLHEAIAGLPVWVPIVAAGSLEWLDKPDSVIVAAPPAPRRISGGPRRSVDGETETVGRTKRGINNPKNPNNPKKLPAAMPKSGSAPITDYNGGLIWGGAVSFGTPPVPYTLVFDTGSADLWVSSVNCTSDACAPHKKYNPSASSTSKYVPGKSLSLRYGDGSTTAGPAWSDNVAMAGLSATAQVFGAANTLAGDWNNDPTDGIMGLAFQSISQMNVPPFFRTLMTQSKLAIPQFSFSLSTTPELFLGGMNPSLFVAGTTVWYPVTAQSYWIIKGNANVNGNTAVGGIGCIIDTGTSVIVAPTGDAAAFWRAVPGSAEYGGGYYTYSCSSPPTLGFSFGSNGKQWNISPNTLNLGRVSAGSDRCVGAIVGNDIGLTAWVIGDAFLENVYSTFDFATNSVGFSRLA